MRSPEQTHRPNRWFTVAAVCAAAMAGAHFSDAMRPQAASAQPDDEFKSPFNSAGDRKMLIDQLKDVNQRLGRIEAQLKNGISVKVTEMPKTKDGDAAAPKP